ncbi:major facilitator transporter [Sinomonas atrocyanea]|uniref:Major facilitator transporter n=3 Tax=Sinomonas atrocyanea TaxID=37927 RepID=A0A126ZY25_9MICC|nr:major facilitator transporter [Sinomonas atrocyanea]GEB65512.1 MFS transporter [Sinomonas atrocyanea]
MQPADAAAPQMSHKQILEALTGLLAAFFTAILSSTIVSNALPTIMADLKGTQTDFAWIITASLLASAVTVPIWGKLADLFDKKLLTQLNIIIFVIGSVVAGISQSIPEMIAARVVQGIGMGGLMALAQAIIGAMIPPRERGRYSGYMGAVMAVGTAGGPLLGGFIVDSPLGWRWTFFVCVPLAVVSLILIQATLKLKHVRRHAKIDWLGSLLLSASVSTVLIWVSFAGQPGYYDWWSWQTGAMLGGALVGIVLLIIVESKVAQPIIPLKIIADRTTALSIIASAAVGVSMYASSSFLGQYFQVARGATPTEAGLLTLPMIAGNFLGSVVTGQLITRFGRWKGYLLAGTVFTAGGMGLLGTIDHTTDLAVTGVFSFVLGLGLGMTMQNLVLAVQNTVPVAIIGTASSTVAFFRSVFGAIGVLVLGTVLNNRSTNLITQGLAAKGIKVPAGSTGGASLDFNDMPAPLAGVVRAAFGDASAESFLVAGIIGVVAVLAVLFIKEVPLRRTVDIVKPAQAGGAPGANPATASLPSVAPIGAHDAAASPEAPGSPSSVPAADEGEPVRAGRPAAASARRAAIREVLAGAEGEGAALDTELALLLAESAPAAAQAAAPAAAGTLEALQETQRILARQQAQLASLMERLADQLDEQQRLAAEQGATAKAQGETAAQLAQLQQELDAERQLQKEAALYLATRGRHSAN